jgi:fumarate hydratase class I
MIRKGESLPVDFRNRVIYVIYYVGPADPVRDEIVRPAGPTTATRMDKFTGLTLAETGLIAMIGKGERGPEAIEAIRRASLPTPRANPLNRRAHCFLVHFHIPCTQHGELT